VALILTPSGAMMTGCRLQYTIVKNAKTGNYYCMARYNMKKQEWSPYLSNSPQDDMASGDEHTYGYVPWPEVGGGGAGNTEITKDELYQKMCAWDKENYIVAAGCTSTRGKENAEGMVSNHAYTVIDAHPQVAGTNIDLFRIRNPWGSGEMEQGMFDDDGPGWDQYPQIKAKLNPVEADDGIFYQTKDEFFTFFDTIYLSASNMTAFKED
jgi:hypothetical protein